MKDKTQLPEAPASVTYSLITPKGFPILYTLRDENGLGLLEKMTALESKLVEDGFKPQMKGYATPPKVTDPNAPICAVHNAPMTWKEGISKSTGKPYGFWGCSQKMPDGSWCNFKPDMIKKGF